MMRDPPHLHPLLLLESIIHGHLIKTWTFTIKMKNRGFFEKKLKTIHGDYTVISEYNRGVPLYSEIIVGKGRVVQR